MSYRIARTEVWLFLYAKKHKRNGRMSQEQSKWEHNEGTILSMWKVKGGDGENTS